MNYLFGLLYEIIFVYPGIENLNYFWNFGIYPIFCATLQFICKVAGLFNDDIICCMTLLPMISSTKSEDNTYAHYLLIRDLDPKPMSYKDFYDVCGPFPLSGNSYFSVSLLIQPAKGSYVANKGVYVIISDRNLESSISVSKKYFNSFESTFHDGFLPNKSFSTILPLLTFAKLIVKKEGYLGDYTSSQLENVIIIAESLEKILLFWAEKGVNIFHLSAGLRFFPPEIEKEHESECKDLIEKFKVFTLQALVFLVAISDSFIDRILDPETVVLYEEQFNDLGVFKSIVLSKIKAGSNDFCNGSKVSKTSEKGRKSQLLSEIKLDDVQKRKFHTSGKNYSPSKDNSMSKIVVQSAYRGLRRLLAPIEAGDLSHKAQSVEKFTFNKSNSKSLLVNKPSFSQYLQEKNIYTTANNSSSGNVNTSALAALHEYVKQKADGKLLQLEKFNFNSAVDNELHKSAEKLGVLVGSLDVSKDINFLKLLILGMSFEDPQLLHNCVHVICLSLDSQVTMENLMVKGPAQIVELDNISKLHLKKILVDGKHVDINPVFNKCIEHPVVLSEGPLGITFTNVTGSSKAVWTPNRYYADRLSKFGIPTYRIYRQDSLAFGFKNFGYTISPHGKHVYDHVNMNLLHSYLHLPKTEVLAFDKNFVSTLTKVESYDFSRKLDLAFSEHLKYGTAVSFTEISRDSNLQFSHDIGGYCNNLIASDGYYAMEQLGLANSYHKPTIVPIDYDNYFQNEKHKLVRQLSVSTTTDQNLLSSSMSREIVAVRSFYMDNLDDFNTLVLYKNILDGNTVSVSMLSIPHKKKAFEGMLFAKVLPPHPIKPFKDMDGELEELCSNFFKNFKDIVF